MPISDTYQRLPLEAIKVIKEGPQARQRTKVVTEGLLESVRRHGVLHPIIVTRELTLVAGECRLEASKTLGIPDIPVRFLDELSVLENQTIELEENLKRSALGWMDEVRAIARLHGLYASAAKAEDRLWHQRGTAEALGVGESYVSKVLRVAKDIEDPKVQAAGNIMTAYNLLDRKDTRKRDTLISDLLATGTIAFGVPAAAPSIPGAPLAAPTITISHPVTAIPTLANLDDSLLQADFLSWAPLYEGRKFNFLHCDFPYGINVFGGEQGNASGTAPEYDDDPAVFWRLMKGLADHLERLLLPSAHLMFWYSMDMHSEVLRALRLLMPSVEWNPKPLIWMKSDNVGIIQDAKRGPRHVYEAALFGSRGDRLVVKSIGDAYSAPTDRKYHPSAKPEPMLRQFFQMFVDEHTELLDPTCGGGSALRAAESLGAKRVLGLEQDQEHFEAARHALRQFRTMKRMEK